MFLWISNLYSSQVLIYLYCDSWVFFVIHCVDDCPSCPIHSKQFLIFPIFIVWLFMKPLFSSLFHLCISFQSVCSLLQSSLIFLISLASYACIFFVIFLFPDQFFHLWLSVNISLWCDWTTSRSHVEGTWCDNEKNSNNDVGLGWCTAKEGSSGGSGNLEHL